MENVRISKNKSIILKISIVFAAMLWGGSFPVLKGAIDSYSVYCILGVRSLIGGLLLGLIFFKRMIKINRAEILAGVLMGLVVTVGNIFQTVGLKYTTPGKNAFLTASYCVLVPIFCFMFFRKHLSKYNLIGAIIVAFGIGFITLDELSLQKGDVLSLIGGVFFAWHFIVTMKVTQGKDAIRCSVIQILTIGVISSLISIIFEKGAFTFNFDTTNWLRILFLAIGPTAICLTIQAVANKYLKPTTVSLYISLESVFAVVYSVILGYESLQLIVTVGFVLSFIGIFISESELDFLKKRRVEKIE